MRDFKKKTVVLILASVVTVAASFAENFFKNTITGLDFILDKNGSGALQMSLKTKTKYIGNVTPIKKSADTYVLMLPEVDSNAALPDVSKYSGQVKDISISTLPYTSSGKGYTKIVIKTQNVPYMTAINEIFIPENNSFNNNFYNNNNVSSDTLLNQEFQSETNNDYNKELEENEEISTVSEPEAVDTDTNVINKTEINKQEETNNTVLPLDETTTKYVNQSQSHEKFLLVMSVLLVIAVSVYLYTRTQNKMTDIAGENFKIDIDIKETKKEDKPKKLKQIKDSINSLDRKYPKTISINKYEALEKNVEIKPVETEEELNIVDLDELFKKNSEENNVNGGDENTNIDLEDFLNNFTFEEALVEDVENEGYDVEFYDEVLSDDKLKFSKYDIECIGKLLNSEIDNSTLNNLDNYLISNPIKKKRTKEEIIEEFVTTYAVSQNIMFNQDDIKALNKLISVEIDSSFVTDLKIDNYKSEDISQNIEEIKSETQHSVSSILKVRDMLPDLSEELRKHGNKEIQSNNNKDHNTVYCQSGYDVKTISVNSLLPDLKKELNNDLSYESKPTASYQLADDLYGVEKLNVDKDYPDLKDLLLNIDNDTSKDDKKSEVKFEAKEETLLNHINNVTFKPFDEAKDFEIINEIEEEKNVDIESVEETTMIDLDEISKAQEGFQEDLPENSIDLANAEESVQQIVTDRVIDEKKDFIENTRQKRSEEIKNIARKEAKKTTTEILQKIQERRNNYKKNVVLKLEKEVVKDEDEIVVAEKKDIKCIVNNKSYNVLSSVVLENNKGCHLAKNDSGYTVLGYINDELFVLKQYEELKSQKIQARKNEELGNGITNYIIRIGLKKFIVQTSATGIKYLMDLC